MPTPVFSIHLIHRGVQTASRLFGYRSPEPACTWRFPRLHRPGCSSSAFSLHAIGHQQLVWRRDEEQHVPRTHSAGSSDRVLEPQRQTVLLPVRRSFVAMTPARILCPDPPLSLLSTGLPSSMSACSRLRHGPGAKPPRSLRFRGDRSSIPRQALRFSRHSIHRRRTGVPRPTPTSRRPGQTHHLSRQNQRLFATFYGACEASSVTTPRRRPRGSLCRSAGRREMRGRLGEYGITIPLDVNCRPRPRRTPVPHQLYTTNPAPLMHFRGAPISNPAAFTGASSMFHQILIVLRPAGSRVLERQQRRRLTAAFAERRCWPVALSRGGSSRTRLSRSPTPTPPPAPPVAAGAWWPARQQKSPPAPLPPPAAGTSSPRSSGSKRPR